MISLVSPEYNFETFCNHMRGKNPLAIMEAASTEISYARRLNRESTNDSEFRKGSRGWEYCENLQKLISLIMNGSVPAGSSSEFLITVEPLIHQLLRGWEMGGLRKMFSNLKTQERPSLPMICNPLILVISRAEVEAMDTSAALDILQKLTESADRAREFMESVDIVFHGYDHTCEEVFENPEVRNFVYRLDEQFPFWLYFLSKRHFGLLCLLLCFVPPFLTADERSKIFPGRINNLLTKRWFPAMNKICAYVGLSERQIERLTERALAYITKGKLPLDSEPFA